MQKEQSKQKEKQNKKDKRTKIHKEKFIFGLILELLELFFHFLLVFFFLFEFYLFCFALIKDDKKKWGKNCFFIIL